MMIRALLSRTALAVTLITLAPVSRAQIASFWMDSTNFDYSVQNMPDIDQRRDKNFLGTILGLPGKGNMYCVPTSLMNIVAYIANHGYGYIGPFVDNWQLSPPFPQYNLMTGWLKQMGSFMKTDAVKGTYGGPAQNGLQFWLDSWSPGDFAVTLDYAHDNYAPLFTDIAKNAIGGSLISVGVGWYGNIDMHGAPQLRNGGHNVTLVHASGPGFIGTDYTLGINDPARAENPTNFFAQSLFGEDDYKIIDQTESFGYVDGNNMVHYNQRTQSRPMGFGSASIDGYFAVTPKKGLAAQPTGFYFLKPIDLLAAEVGGSSRFYPIDGHVQDVAINPTRTEHPYLVQGRNLVCLFDEITGMSRPFADVVDPLRLVLGGPRLNCYVLCQGHLDCIDRSGRKVVRPLEMPVDAIAYDDIRNLLLAYSLTTKKLYRYHAETLAFVDSFDVPPGPCRAGDTLHMSFSPIDPRGMVFFHGDGFDSFTRVSFPERGVFTQQIMLPDVMRPMGFHADERGMIFVTDDGVIKTFDRNGMPAPSRFGGKPGGYLFRLLRPYSNYDYKAHTGPSFWNVLPEDAAR